MIKDIITWGIKACFQLVLWVFLLSISWDGRTLFDRTHEIIVDNEVVESLDLQLRELWEEISRTAQTTFSEVANKKDENI